MGWWTLLFLLIIPAVAVLVRFAPYAPRSPSQCPRGLSANRTHPYCPCRLHQSAVQYRGEKWPSPSGPTYGEGRHG
jgi:hypothetical protein